MIHMTQKHPKKRLMTPEGMAYHLFYLEDQELWCATLPWCPRFHGKTIGVACAKLTQWLFQEKN